MRSLSHHYYYFNILRISHTPSFYAYFILFPLITNPSLRNITREANGLIANFNLTFKLTSDIGNEYRYSAFITCYWLIFLREKILKETDCKEKVWWKIIVLPSNILRGVIKECTLFFTMNASHSEIPLKKSSMVFRCGQINVHIGDQNLDVDNGQMKLWNFLKVYKIWMEVR